MTIVKITRDDIERFTVVTHPTKRYSTSGYDQTSGTYTSVTGTVDLFARRSDSVKETSRLASFLERDVKEGAEDNIDELYIAARTAAQTLGSNFDQLRTLLSSVNDLSGSRRQRQQIEIVRFEPPFTLNKDFVRKRVIRELLYPFYRDIHPSLHWAYTNYHTLNFFTGPSVPTGSVLMYPNKNAKVGLSTSGSVDGNIYIPRGPVTFDFRVNMRYENSGTFVPSTLFHLPDVYALSIVSGSDIDSGGNIASYRLMLQTLDGVRSYTPSDIDVDNPPQGVYLSDDVLRFNRWHHVLVRWGTSTVDLGTGSFVVDGVEVGTFNINSSSLIDGLTLSPDVLFIGNFYSGSVVSSSVFFSSDPALREGLVELVSLNSIDSPPSDHFSFSHPCNAEVHELRIWDRFVDDDLLSDVSSTLSSDKIDDMLFYVPPFFTKESPYRRVIDGTGGVFRTPFFSVDGSTFDPFNVELSFGVGGHYINLENFTRDFANDNYPRLWLLSGSVISSTGDVKSADDLMFSTGTIRKRNLTVLPCDDGLFAPCFTEILRTGSIDSVPKSGSINDKYTNDLGVYDASLISLTDMLPEGSWMGTLTMDSGSMFDAAIGSSPSNISGSIGNTLAIYQRTRDNSSNQIVIFDISNVFYGNKLAPGTITLTDNAVTGSAGRVSITLKDDGRGSLYRADSLTPHARWASVGNVLYDEGLIVVKTPGIPYFGREGFDLTFKGERNVHVFKMRVLADAGLINSSSNPTYDPNVRASNDANDYDDEFVYITGINVHDSNMNVIMKTTLAQPVVKRSGDRIVFKIGYDY